MKKSINKSINKNKKHTGGKTKKKKLTNTSRQTNEISREKKLVHNNE